MQYLIERIGANICTFHNKPIEFICYDIDCMQPYRRMCSQCNEKREPGLYISVKQVTEFLDEYQPPIEAILECLKDNEEIQFWFTKVFQYKQISQLYNAISDAPMSGPQIELLGKLLSTTIKVSSKNKNKIEFQGLNPNIGLQICRTLIDQKLIVGTAINILLESFQQIKVMMAQFELKQVLKFNSKEIEWIQLSSNSKLLAISFNRRIILYDVDLKAKRIRQNSTLTSKNFDVYKMAFNADSTILAACGVAYEQQQYVAYGQFNPSGCKIHNNSQLCNELISGNERDGTAKFYLHIISRWKLHRKLCGQQQWFNKIIISPNSKYIAIGGDELTLYAMPISKQMKQVLYTPPVEDLSDLSVTMAFNKESNLLVSGRNSVDVVIWRLNTITNDWEYEQSLPNTAYEEIGYVSINSLSNMIIINCGGPAIDVWKRNRQNVWVLNQKLDMKKMHIIKSVITSDSTMLISMNNFNYIYVHVQDI